MAEQRLNQVLAVEAGLKSRWEQEQTAAYHTLQKSALFDGMTRTYKPLSESAERLPTEHKKVQQEATTMLKNAFTRLEELFDTVATKDFANCNAKADVIVDGYALLKDVPATYLLFLEKKLIDVRTMIEKLPTLDPAENWVKDANDGFYKTERVETSRTAKIAEPLLLAPATKEHPAQTQVVNVDRIIGYYEVVKLSGAYPVTDQQKLLLRVEKLQAAVKRAREAANVVVAPQQTLGFSIFNWLMTGY